MTADRREQRTGRLLPAERNLGHFGQFAEAPFPNGVLSTYGGKDSGWTINNDGSLITFTHSDKTTDAFRRHDISVINKFWDYPVLGGVFTSRRFTDSSGDEYHITTIPTVSTANRLSKDVFSDLPTAGVELVQTSNTGEVPLLEYLNYLMSGKMPVSKGYSMYRHDLFDHWLGAATLKDREFEVFKALCGEIGPIGLEFGRQTQIYYMRGLGKAFDYFTGNIITSQEIIRSAHRPETQITLPGQCLAQFRLLGNDVYGHSEQIVTGFDTSDNPLLRTVGNGTYYGNVFKTLRQPKWTPQPAVR